MAHMKRDVSMLDRERLTLGGAGRLLLVAGLVVGVGGLAISYVLGRGADDGMHHFMYAYLLNFMFLLSLSLGALWFVPLQHLTRSSWSTVIRRLAEIVSGTIPVLGLLAVPILLNLDVIYPWADPAHAAGDPLMAHKLGFLSVKWFTFRVVLYFVIWTVLAYVFRRWSAKQDQSGDLSYTFRSERLGGPALLVYGLTQTLAAFDLMMSLDAHWFSTMFGVYWFAGIVAAFFALMTLLTWGLQRSGRLSRIVTVEHYNDYGRAMFAFVFFWAYIAFSQYMLIWYANIPEETGWFLRRQENGWSAVGYLLIFGHWLVPFAGLMSRFTKRRVALMVFWAVWILVMHWVDLFWLIMPELSPGGVPLQLMDVTLLAGLGGLYVAALALLAGDRSLIARRDPRLQESLNFENY
ncbi:quinol:cytochrome C oxidoreductase [bacterium]|nr:quinol:cytochrome C oxidoreductase [bacterium]MBU1072328.1 quinol:cytochrome C oxidoreductase [bacterium]MBU1674373.1 quinol:cytochrome C oxidoreductase [bacterium]